MIPNLITRASGPNDPGPNYNGLFLVDCLSCRVKEERNGSYELEMEYAANGQHANSLQPGYYIKAKPNFTDDPQLFEIYKIGKNINGRFTINAQHISYELSGKVITTGSANNIVTAVTSVLQSAARPFTLLTTKNTQGNFVITEPSSVRSWFGGKQGSLLDVYGTGEWHYDNFTATLMLHRGEDRGVTIRYGKNLTELSQEVDMSNILRGVIGYYKDEAGNVTVAPEVRTGITWMSKTIAVDFSQDVDPNSSTSIVSQLTTLAQNYVSNHNVTTMLSTITLDFVQLKDLAERVDLCDTVHIYFEPLEIEASMKCISTTWDVLEERYIETVFGDPKASIADSFEETSARADAAQASANTAQTSASAAQTKANRAQTVANSAYQLAGDKKRVFIDTPVPPYDVGDLWVNGSNIYYCIVPKTTTETGEVSGELLEFNTPIAAPLLNCTVTLPQDPVGYDHIVIKVSNGQGITQESYEIALDQTITTGGVLNVTEGVITLPDETTIEITPVTINTLEGDNQIVTTIYLSDSQVTANTAIEYLIEGFQLSDWNLGTDYVSESRLEDAVNAASDIITGTAGGYVVIHDSNLDHKPDEILIMDTDDIKTATKIWRWNSGGLGYSSTGYNGRFSPAIDSEGRIVADMITTGSLDALKVTVEHLNATMFEGGKISLGGLNNQSGVLEIKDESGVVIGELTKLGLKFYGAGPVGQRPYVVLNNTDGFKGYDALGNPLFWVNRDEFNMTKCVAVNEINACGMLRMLPMTIENSGTVVNRGLAFIPVV